MGTTRDLSSSGISFRCRRTLPEGCHVELTIEWPARHEDTESMELVVTGQIIRSDGGRIAVRMSSRRFRTGSLQSERYRATA
jgi:hypothetical protein